jgi:hypothetical protein
MENFNTQQNKGAIWNLMYQEGIFQDIKDDHVQNVKADFDKKMNEISGRNSDNKSLTELNKTVITEMINDMAKYKTVSYNNSYNDRNVTAKDISDKRQMMFQKGLEKRQNDFTNAMNERKPDKMNFSDEPDKPIGAEMDSMLADILASRESQLNIVLDTQSQSSNAKEANNWINKDSTMQGQVNKVQHIKIGEPAILGIVDEVVSTIPSPTKKVSFEEIPSFLDKLKKKPDKIIELNAKLDILIQGQNKIIELLSNKEKITEHAEEVSELYINKEIPKNPPRYASPEPDDGIRKYNDDRNWDGGSVSPAN